MRGLIVGAISVALGIVACDAFGQAKPTTAERDQGGSLESALALMQIKEVEHLFASGQADEAVAQLATVVRRSPSNRLAVERLMSALTFQPNLGRPEHLERAPGTWVAAINPGASLALIRSTNGTAWTRDMLTGNTVSTQMNIGGTIHRIAFSEDGEWVAFVLFSKGVEVWNARSGIPAGVILRHEDDEHRSFVGVFLSPDGRLALTESSFRGTAACMWEVATGRHLWSLQLGNDTRVLHAAFSPDGKCVAAVVLAVNKWKPALAIYDTETGKRILDPLEHYDYLNYAAFSQDGKHVLSASSDGTARVWNTTTGKPVTAPLPHSESVRFGAFSPDGHQVVTTCEAVARLWNAYSGEALGKPLRHEFNVTFAEFSFDGQRLLTIEEDRTVRIWDPKSGVALSEPLKHEAPVINAHFTRDGQRLVTVTTAGNAKIWDVRTPRAEPCPAWQLMQRYSTAPGALTSSGLCVETVSFTSDQVARLRDLRTGGLVGEPLKHSDSIRHVSISPDGQRVLTASMDGTARIWDASTGRPVTTLQHSSWVNSAVFSPDGQRVITGSFDRTARVWDSATGRPVTGEMQHGGSVNEVAFSPDGLRVLTVCGGESAVRIWDAIAGKSLMEPLTHQVTVNFAVFSPDGSQILIATGDVARLINGFTGARQPGSLKHDQWIVTAAFSLDARRIATASRDKTARIWDAQHGEPLVSPLKHTSSVFRAEFNSDASRLLTVTSDGDARIWDVSTGQPLTESLRVGRPWPAFSPDGQRLVMGTNVLELPFFSSPPPDWLPDLAEAFVGKKVNANRVLESIAEHSRSTVLRQIRQQLGDDVHSDWAKWLLEERPRRANWHAEKRLPP